MKKQEFYDKYGKVNVVFEHYSKHEFTFKGKLPTGEHLIVTIGGYGPDLYSITVKAKQKVKVEELDANMAVISDNEKFVKVFDIFE